MKKLFFVSAILLNFSMCFAQNGMIVKNSTSCTIKIQFQLHDIGYSCGSDKSVVYTVTAGGGITFSSPIDLMMLVGTPSASASWDRAEVIDSALSCYVVIGPSGGCGSYPTSATLSCDCGSTAYWVQSNAWEITIQ